MSQYGNYLLFLFYILGWLVIVDYYEYKFLEGIDNWLNYCFLLLLVFYLIGGDVYEFGCGDGSIFYFCKYCEVIGRCFCLFESNEVWVLRCGFEFVKNWDDDMFYWFCLVVFVDYVFGEYRYIVIKWLVEFVDIIVVYDVELYGVGNY